MNPFDTMSPDEVATYVTTNPYALREHHMAYLADVWAAENEGSDAASIVLNALALHPHVTPVVLDSIARYPVKDPASYSKDWQSAVAVHRDVSDHTIQYLAQKGSEDARCAVAYETRNQDLLRRMSKDKSPYVLINVAKNLATPKDVLTSLAGHDDADVRFAVAANMNNYPDILALLIEDEDDDVRETAVDNLR